MIFWFGRPCRSTASRSPAICSRTNWSYGMSCVEARRSPSRGMVQLRDREVAVAAGGVGVADHVEPVPAPPLAVLRATPAGGPRPSRRRSGESSARNASISSGVGGRPVRSKVARRISVRLSAGGDRAQALGLELRQDEAVDRVADPSRRPSPRAAAAPDRLERPELLLLRPVDGSCLAAVGGGLAASRVGATIFDPLLEDLRPSRVGNFSFGGICRSSSV